jgi:hypothetical protein
MIRSLLHAIDSLGNSSHRILYSRIKYIVDIIVHHRVADTLNDIHCAAIAHAIKRVVTNLTGPEIREIYKGIVFLSGNKKMVSAFHKSNLMRALMATEQSNSKEELFVAMSALAHRSDWVNASASAVIQALQTDDFSAVETEINAFEKMCDLLSKAIDTSMIIKGICSHMTGTSSSQGIAIRALSKIMRNSRLYTEKTARACSHNVLLSVIQAIRANSSVGELGLKLLGRIKVHPTITDKMKDPIVKIAAKCVIDLILREASAAHLPVLMMLIDKTISPFDPAWYDEVVSAILTTMKNTNDDDCEFMCQQVLSKLIWYGGTLKKRPRESVEKGPSSKAAKTA